MIERNGKGIWSREIEKALPRFDASLEWFMERVQMREEQLEKFKTDGQMEECAKMKMLRDRRRKSIDEVLEEVEVVVDTHFFNKLSETNSSVFLKKAIENQNAIEMNLLKKT